MSMMLQCPTCAGTGWDTHGNRHTRTRMDACRPCAGTGMIRAQTGEVREAAFDPETGRPFGEARQDGDDRR